MRFFPAKYIIRLDDACHQLPYKKWKKFEDYFIENNIKPIVGVIPKNRDKILGDNYSEDFWEIIKKWEKSGWSIALHGLNHILHPIDSSKTFFDFGDKSEFVGLNQNYEEKKIIENSVNELEKKFNKEIVTYVRSFDKFYQAEVYHQDFYVKKFQRYLEYKKACRREEILNNIWNL